MLSHGIAVLGLLIDQAADKLELHVRIEHIGRSVAKNRLDKRIDGTIKAADARIVTIPYRLFNLRTAQ
jgi:fructose-specific phosphotransferase system component IIB